MAVCACALHICACFVCVCTGAAACTHAHMHMVHTCAPIAALLLRLSQSRLRAQAAVVRCDTTQSHIRYGTVKLRDGRLLAYHEETRSGRCAAMPARAWVHDQAYGHPGHVCRNVRDREDCTVLCPWQGDGAPTETVWRPHGLPTWACNARTWRPRGGSAAEWKAQRDGSIQPQSRAIGGVPRTPRASRVALGYCPRNCLVAVTACVLLLGLPAVMPFGLPVSIASPECELSPAHEQTTEASPSSSMH